MKDQIIVAVAVLTAVYFALRAIILRYIVGPALAKQRAAAAKASFQAQQKSVQEEIARLTREVENAQAIYNRAKRDALRDPKDPTRPE
jgi:hypothetical protein